MICFKKRLILLTLHQFLLGSNEGLVVDDIIKAEPVQERVIMCSWGDDRDCHGSLSESFLFLWHLL
jgi:hypothetical protein